MSKLGGLENPRGVIHYTGSIYACRANKACQAVRATKGTPAASSIVMFLGFGATSAS